MKGVRIRESIQNDKITRKFDSIVVIVKTSNKERYHPDLGACKIDEEVIFNTTPNSVILWNKEEALTDEPRNKCKDAEEIFFKRVIAESGVVVLLVNLEWTPVSK